MNLSEEELRKALQEHAEEENVKNNSTDNKKKKSKKYFNYEGKFIVSHWRQGERTKSSTLFSFVWRKQDCSLTTEYTLLQVLHSVFRAADGAAR